MSASNLIFAALNGHMVHADGWCARCQRRHPYVDTTRAAVAVSR